MTDRSHTSGGESPASLLGDVFQGFTRLITGEIALARAEAERSLRDAAKAIGLFAVAAIIAIAALNVLSGAAVAGVVRLGLPPHWAAVVVGAALFAAAAGLAYYAKRLLQPVNPGPGRSYENLRRDAETLKSMVTPSAPADRQF